MQPQRLSYDTAGADVQPRHETTGAARHVVLATLFAVHGVAVVGLLDASRWRDGVTDAKPVFLAVVDAPAPVAPSRPLPPPPSLQAPKAPPLQLPLIAPEPSLSPSPMVAQALASPPPAPGAPAADPVAAPAPTAASNLPSAAIQFLVPPAPVYSRISARMRESGKVVVRVFIDEAGLPHDVRLSASSGFARLDDSALAAVRAARFKPCLENGMAVSGWASVPIDFELPK